MTAEATKGLKGPGCPCCGCTDQLQDRIVKCEHPVLERIAPQIRHRRRCNCCSFEGHFTEFYPDSEIETNYALQ